MPKQQIPMIKGDSVGVETDYRDSLPVNMLAVSKVIQGANGYLLPHYGLTKFGDTAGVDRGGIYNERFRQHLRISWTKFQLIDEVGAVSVIGGITGSKQAALPYSFNSQCIITDGKMWLYSPTEGLVQVTDVNLGSPLDGIWIDGYYFMTDGSYLFHTDLVPDDDSDNPFDYESSIDPLKFATAEFSPDPTIGVGKTQDNKAIAFGRYTTEYFLNQANENFAFTRVSNRAQKIGIVATHAKAEVGGAWFFCGSRKNESLGIHILGVGSSQKISTREIDKVLAQYTEPELADMRIEGREEDNVQLVYVHLPNECLCFNVTTAGELGQEYGWSILTTGNAGQAWRGINGVFDARISKWIYGDKTDAVMALIDDTTFAQYDVAAELEFFTPFINLETMCLDGIELETIAGFTDLDDATLAFSMTKDGINYSMEYWNLYGEPLDYSHRYILRRLGYIDQWVGLKFRAVTKSRMAFAQLSITYG